MMYKEGKNFFSEFDTIQFYLQFPKKRRNKSCEVKFGGYVQTKCDNVSSELRKYSHTMKKFFYNKSKDGYFKNKFIYLDGTTNNLKLKGQGLSFPSIYLYFEEEYENDFVIDYFKGVFNELNILHKEFPKLKFSKYADRPKLNKQDR